MPQARTQETRLQAARLSRPPGGTQSIVRTVQLLKVLGARKQRGWRLTDLAAHCGLKTSTVYRMLSCLCELRLARQRPQDKRYVPGAMLYEFSLGVPVYAQFQAACHPRLLQLSAKTGWVVFLGLRSGEDSVCIDRVGTTSVNILNEVGRRLPLAGSALGVAMLLALPQREQQRILAANRRVLRSNTAHRDRTYNQMWQRSREMGVGLNLGNILPGGASMGVPILNTARRPVAAISVAGPRPEFTERRVQSVRNGLRDMVARIEREQADLIAQMDAMPD